MDLSSWLTSDETAGRLGVKYRTLLDMVRRGLLHPQKTVRTGVAGGAVSMFDPAEVDALAGQRIAARTEIVSSGPVIPPAKVSNHASMQSAHMEQNEQLPAVVPFDRRPFVTISEAVQITGLGAFYIERNVKGQPIGPNRTTVYRRRDLDALCAQ